MSREWPCFGRLLVPTELVMSAGDGLERTGVAVERDDTGKRADVVR